MCGGELAVLTWEEDGKGPDFFAGYMSHEKSQQTREVETISSFKLFLLVFLPDYHISDLGETQHIPPKKLPKYANHHALYGSRVSAEEFTRYFQQNRNRTIQYTESGMQGRCQ